MERVKKHGGYHWWGTFLGWSLIATGNFSLMLHPVVILLTLKSMSIAENNIVYKSLVLEKGKATSTTKTYN